MGNGHSSVLPSELLAEFEPERILGKPDRAETWLVRRRRDGLPAIARIERCGPVNPRERSRFHDAYLTLRRLRHPGLPRLLQGGVTSMSGHYIVHEFVPGASLRNLRRNLDAAMVIEVVVQLIPVLYLLHHHRLTHQRVTPEKIIVEGLGPGCRVRLVDPPISTADDGRRWVAPPYRCPELDEDQLWDARSDLYGLSLSIFESVSGTHPFPTLRREGDSYLTVCRDVPPLSRVRADMPAALIDILQRMGSAYPAERPLTVLKLHSDLRRARLIARDRPALDLEALVSATRTPGLEPRGRDMVAQLPDGWQPAGVEADPAVADLADDLEARLRLRRSRRILKAEAGGGEPEHFGLRVVPVARGAGGEVRGPTESDPYYTVSVRPPDVDDLRRRLIRLCRGPLHQRRSLLLARWLRWRFEADEASIERFLLEHLTSDDEAAFLDWDRVGASILASLPVRWPRRFRNAWSDFPSGIPNRDVAVLRRYCMTAEAAEYLRRLYDSEGVSPSRALTLSRQDLAVAQHEEHAYLYVFAEKTRLQAARRIAGSLPGTAERILLRAARITQTPFAEMAEKYQFPLPKKFEDNPDPPDLLLHLARLIVHADEESRKGPLQARAVYQRVLGMRSSVAAGHKPERSMGMYSRLLEYRGFAAVVRSNTPTEALDFLKSTGQDMREFTRTEKILWLTAEAAALIKSSENRKAAKACRKGLRTCMEGGQIHQGILLLSNHTNAALGMLSAATVARLARHPVREVRRADRRQRRKWSRRTFNVCMYHISGDVRSALRCALQDARRNASYGSITLSREALMDASVNARHLGKLALSVSIARRIFRSSLSWHDIAPAYLPTCAYLATVLRDSELSGRVIEYLRDSKARISQGSVVGICERLLLRGAEPATGVLDSCNEHLRGCIQETRSRIRSITESDILTTAAIRRHDRLPLQEAIAIAERCLAGSMGMSDSEFVSCFRIASCLLNSRVNEVAARVSIAVASRCCVLGLMSEARDILELSEKALRRLRLSGLESDEVVALREFTLECEGNEVRRRLALQDAIGESVGGSDTREDVSPWRVVDVQTTEQSIGSEARILAETLLRVSGSLKHVQVTRGLGDGKVSNRVSMGKESPLWSQQTSALGVLRGHWPCGVARWRDLDGSLVLTHADPRLRVLSIVAGRPGCLMDIRERMTVADQAREISNAVRRVLTLIAVNPCHVPLPGDGREAGALSGGCSDRTIVRSERLSRVMYTIERLAGQRVPIVLVGESGTGKELLARHAHDCSPMSTGNFVPVDCPSLSAGLAEAELFGHTKGAFSGAVADKPGLVFDADKGTLFLDEVGDLPLDIQAKLLRVLSTREVRQVGSNKARTAQFLLVSATNADLDVMVREGRFRLDLRHRLGVEVRVPPLRERKEEIMPLWEIFLAQALGGRNAVSEQGVRDLLEDHLWPGNIRELKALASACAALLDGARVTTKLIESLLKPEKGPPPVDTSHPFFGKPRLQEGLCFIRSRGTVSRRAYVAALRISSRTATRDLEEMVRAGVVLRVGTGRGCRYVMKQEKPG